MVGKNWTNFICGGNAKRLGGGRSVCKMGLEDKACLSAVGSIGARQSRSLIGVWDQKTKSKAR